MGDLPSTRALPVVDAFLSRRSDAARAPRPEGPAESRGSLTLHTSLVEKLPALLLVYVGCAAVLVGDYRHADLVKIHIGSGKLSLMRYDDYGEAFEPPFLYRKSRYINEEFPHYPEQVAFDEALEGLGLFDFSGYGPRPGELAATLAGG